MIRVAFILGGLGNEWLGGLNYYRNLVTALELLDERRIEPVIFVGRHVSTATFDSFGKIEIVRSSVFDRNSIRGFLWRFVRRLPGKGRPMLSRLLEHHRIDVLSHYEPLARRSRIRTIGWIPDFQHVHLPEFFSEAERHARDEHFRWLYTGCDVLVLSSESAMKDLQAISPESVHKTRVLRFSPEVGRIEQGSTLASLEQRYDFKAPYFHLPNQFWTHKNHRTVIAAVRELMKRGVSITVLATGRENDHRSPGHFAELMAEVTASGLGSSFRSLGVVPYGDMLALMQHSVAVINPSLFEGWSSTVEEAKALGKHVLLSRLPVHLEQSPDRAGYFAPLDSTALALLMTEALQHQPTIDDVSRLSDAHLLRRKEFAQNYQKIVIALVAGAARSS